MGEPDAGGPPAAWFERAVRAASDPILAIDTGAVVRWANESCSAHFGRPLEDIVGANLLNWLHPEDVERAIASIGTVTRRNIRGTSGLYRLALPDGSWSPLEVSGYIIEDDPDLDGLFLIARYNPMRFGYREVLTTMAGGTPLDEILDRLALTCDRPEWGRRSSIVYDDEIGARRSTGALPLPLAECDLVERAARSAAVEVLNEAAPVDVREAAQLLDVEACVVVGVPDPSGRNDAYLVTWIVDRSMGDLVRLVNCTDPEQLLRLALEQRANRERLEFAAHRDALTGLHNRRHFLQALDDTVSSGDGGFTVFYIDLDRFKAVNDLHGHHVGDEVLVAVARRFEAAVRNDDVVARLGGDEFAILCPTIFERAEVEEIAERLTRTAAEPLSVDHQQVNIGASVGVVVFDHPSTRVEGRDRQPTDGERMLIEADTALYNVKRNGGDGWQLVS